MRKVLIAVGSGVLVLALLAAGILLWLDPEALVAAKKDEVARSVSERLGRELTVGKIDATFWGGFGATVSDVRLARAEPDAPAQFAVRSLDVRLSLWRALISLGRDIRIRRVEIVDLELRAARDASGRWDFQDVLDRLEANAEPPSVDAEPAGGAGALEGVTLSGFVLRNATIEIDDAMLGRPLAVTDLNVTLGDVALGRALDARLSGVLVDGAKKSAVNLRASLSELPRDLQFTPMPDLETEVKITDVDLAPWGGLLPLAALAPHSGRASVDLAASAKDDMARVQVKGNLALGKLVLREGKRRGTPLDATLEIDADLDSGSRTRAPAYRISALSLVGTGIEAGGTLDAGGLSPAGLRSADVNVAIADLRKLVSVLPEGNGLLPAELALEGPFSARVKAEADSVDLKVDLDSARVAWSDLFDKPAGRPLNLALAGTRRGEGLDVGTFALRVDRATLGGTMTLPTAAGAPFLADVKTGEIPLASLRSVVPPFEKALRKGDEVAGTLELSLQAKDVGGKQDARMLLALANLDVKVATAQARGAGSLDVKLVPREKETHLTAIADFGGMTLKSLAEDGAPLLDKPAGMALTLDLELAQTPSRVDLARAVARIGATSISATGHAEGLDGNDPRLDLDLGKVDVAFDDLRRALPGAGALPAGGRLRAGVKFGGSPASLSTVKVSVSDLDLELGRTRLKGSLGLENLDRPVFAFDLASEILDLDALMGLGGGAEPEAQPVPPENPHGLPAETRAMLARVSGKGTLRAGLAIVKGIPMRGFVGTLRMKDGVVTFDALDFELYGGKVSAAGSTFDLPSEHTGYRLKMGIEEMDLGTALAAHTRSGKVFQGKGSHTLDLVGRGLSAADLAATLRGPADIESSRLTLASLDIAGAILGKAREETQGPAGTTGMISSAATSGGSSGAGSSENGSSAGGGSGTALEGLSAAMRFEGGKMRLQKPTTTRTAFGSLTTEGHAFLDSRLDLTSVARLSPETIAAWTGGRVRPKESLPVPLKIGGTWSKPAITGIDSKRLVAELLAGQVTSALPVGSKADAEAKAREAREAAEEKARAAAAESEAAVKAEIDRKKKAAEEAANRAKADAKKAAEDAKKKAEEARKKAEADAKKKAEELKKKAEQEANELLKGFGQ